jgi:hypothetical protein
MAVALHGGDVGRGEQLDGLRRAGELVMSPQDPGQIRRAGLETLGIEVVGGLPADLQRRAEPRSIPLWGLACARTRWPGRRNPATAPAPPGPIPGTSTATPQPARIAPGCACALPPHCHSPAPDPRHRPLVRERSPQGATLGDSTRPLDGIGLIGYRIRNAYPPL